MCKRILIFTLLFWNIFILSSMAAQSQQTAISPSEAVEIVSSQRPDAKILSVKLNAEGVYVVTLRTGGNIESVQVDSQTGATR